MSMESNTPQVSVADLAAAIDAGAYLLDVRETDEWTEARVGAGKLIPLGQLEDRLAEVPTDGPVYVICRSGARSLRGADFLRTHGVDAINVTGGTLAWIEAGRPVASGPA